MFPGIDERGKINAALGEGPRESASQQVDKRRQVSRGEIRADDGVARIGKAGEVVTERITNLGIFPRPFLFAGETARFSNR